MIAKYTVAMGMLLTSAVLNASAASAATEKAETLKQAAAGKAKEFRSTADEQWRETRVKARELHITTEDYIRKHPTRCVAGAIGLAFLIGLIARR